MDILKTISVKARGSTYFLKVSVVIFFNLFTLGLAGLEVGLGLKLERRFQVQTKPGHRGFSSNSGESKYW